MIEATFTIEMTKEGLVLQASIPEVINAPLIEHKVAAILKDKLSELIDELSKIGDVYSMEGEGDGAAFIRKQVRRNDGNGD